MTDPFPDGDDEASAYDPVSAWTGITIPRSASFAGLLLWMAAWTPGFCRVAAEETRDMLVQLHRAARGAQVSVVRTTGGLGPAPQDRQRGACR
ncbi:hypothetical protein AB0L06_42425 [Spirillospora sp. NPDC052269]